MSDGEWVVVHVLSQDARLQTSGVPAEVSAHRSRISYEIPDKGRGKEFHNLLMGGRKREREENTGVLWDSDLQNYLKKNGKGLNVGSSMTISEVRKAEEEDFQEVHEDIGSEEEEIIGSQLTPSSNVFYRVRILSRVRERLHLLAPLTLNATAPLALQSAPLSSLSAVSELLQNWGCIEDHFTLVPAEHLRPLQRHTQELLTAGWERAEGESGANNDGGSPLRVPNSQCPPQKVKQKQWAKRHALWTRWDEGVVMDKESWFYVTPEALALHSAKIMGDALLQSEADGQTTLIGSGALPSEPLSALASSSPLPSLIILDLFAGVGGNTIAFARWGRGEKGGCRRSVVERLVL